MLQRTARLTVSLSLGLALGMWSGLAIAAPDAAICAPRLTADGDITLDEATSTALRCNPLLGAADSTLLAAAARTTQAGLLPNPELSLEVENFGGSGELQGMSAAETTLSIAQSIALGGSRGRRRALADADRRLVDTDRRILERELRRQTTAAYYRLQAAQQRLDLSRELFQLAEGVAHSVDARVAAGKVSPVESTRARIETARAAIAVDRAETALHDARLRLAASWGSADVDFGRALGELPPPTPPPPLATLEQRLGDGPETERLEHAVERRERSLELSKALSVPDLTISVGSRRLRELGLSSWVAGVSLPVPVFDRNQGARRAEELELEAERRHAQSGRVELRSELGSLVARLELAAGNVASVSGTVEPAAAEAFAAVETGYVAGKFSYIDLLQAQQALFEARQLHIDGHLEYAIVRTELERLVGPLGERHVVEGRTP